MYLWIYTYQSTDCLLVNSVVQILLYRKKEINFGTGQLNTWLKFLQLNLSLKNETDCCLLLKITKNPKIYRYTLSFFSGLEISHAQITSFFFFNYQQVLLEGKNYHLSEEDSWFLILRRRGAGRRRFLAHEAYRGIFQSDSQISSNVDALASDSQILGYLDPPPAGRKR